MEVSTLCPPCGFKRLNAGQQVWPPAPLTAEPPHWTHDDSFKENLLILFYFSPVFSPFPPLFSYFFPLGI